MEIKEAAALARKLKENVKTVIVGKDEVIDKVTLCLFCGGHILLEDIPGTGKTTMAKAFAKSLDCGFSPGAVHPRPAAERAHRHQLL